MKATMIGLDLAKNVFQIHAVDETGQAVQKKRLTRGGVEKFFAALAPCRIGMEACAGSHHWARTLIGLGHEVRIVPPQYVRPYVKTNKNDAADAAAICEAMQRPEMRFVPVKSVAQQALLVLHRAREILGRQRVMTINALRGHCAEFGVVVAQGPRHVSELLAKLDAPGDDVLPQLVKQTLRTLAAQLRAIETHLAETDKALLAEHRANAASRRLATIPGIGPITASALVASIGDAKQFASGRHLAAWIGLVPRQHSTGGKTRLGSISKRGDAYLRRLLIHGARSVLRWRRNGHSVGSPWIMKLIAKKSPNVAATALANKNARIAWALLTREEVYTPPAAAEPAPT